MARRKQQLLSVVYHSAATPGTGSLDLDELLTQSRVRNRGAGVTGMLLAENGRFLQVLEGPEDEVRALLARIQEDPRHQHVRVLAEEVLPARRFPDWAMAHGHVGEIEAMPLVEYAEALLEARDELPEPLTRGERIRARFRSGTAAAPAD